MMKVYKVPRNYQYFINRDTGYIIINIRELIDSSYEINIIYLVYITKLDFYTEKIDIRR